MLGSFPGQYPQIALSLIVDGNQIAGRGLASAICPSGSGGGGASAFSGEIAPDGTFTLTQLGANAGIIFTVSGTAPPTGSSTWNGSYTINSTPAFTECTINQTGSFAATKFTALNGTYAGTVPALMGSTATGSVTVSIQMSQGEGVFNANAPGSYIPLSGTITVGGSSCVNHGTTVVTPGGAVLDGPLVFMTFAMDDGSQVTLSGFLDGTDSASIDGAILNVMGGLCDQNGYGGTLTRQ
jgi:hypothetical protein